MDSKEILAKTAKYLNSAYGARQLYDVKYSPYMNHSTGKWRLNGLHVHNLYQDLSTRALFKILRLI